MAAFGGYLVVRLLGPAGNELFLADRLHEPLGYINGQAGYLMLGLWPLIALAERARNHLLSGAAIAGATVLGGLAVLGQTRAIVPAVIVSAIVLVAVLPGRRQRLWALVAVGCGVGWRRHPLVGRVRERPRAAACPTRTPCAPPSSRCSAPARWFGAVWALARWGASAGWRADGTGRLAGCPPPG